MSIFENSTLGVSAVSAESSVGKAVSTRSNIFEMTQLAESAVLRPMEYGMFPHDVRTALAYRIAISAGETRLAEYYAALAGDKFNLSDNFFARAALCEKKKSISATTKHNDDLSLIDIFLTPN